MVFFVFSRYGSACNRVYSFCNYPRTAAIVALSWTSRGTGSYAQSNGQSQRRRLPLVFQNLFSPRRVLHVHVNGFPERQVLDVHLQLPRRGCMGKFDFQLHPRLVTRAVDSQSAGRFSDEHVAEPVALVERGAVVLVVGVVFLPQEVVVEPLFPASLSGSGR